MVSYHELYVNHNGSSRPLTQWHGFLFFSISILLNCSTRRSCISAEGVATIRTHHKQQFRRDEVLHTATKNKQVGTPLTTPMMSPTTSIPSSSISTQPQICHPPYSRYDHRAYPPLPAEIIVSIVTLVVVVFACNMYLSAYLAKRRLLRRVRYGGSEASTWERLKEECVKVGLVRPSPRDRVTMWLGRLAEEAWYECWSKNLLEEYRNYRLEIGCIYLLVSYCSGSERMSWKFLRL